MTKTLAVNKDNDLYLDDQGNIAVATGLQAVLFLCAHEAKALLGEMVLATDQGLPTFQTIFKDTGSVPLYEGALRKALLSVPDVTDILSLDITLVGNDLKYTARIQTIYGEGVVNG